MAKKKPNYKLKALRMESGLKQEELARKSGIALTTYVRKENGITEFTVSECERIAQVLQENPVDIFFNHRVAKETTKMG